MQTERQELVRVVFPALRERLARHRVHLIDIDLRWGVTQEQAEHDGALDFCLSQIDECRPFFVGLLGDRYGWVPNPAPARSMERWPWLADVGGRSMTELEMRYGALNGSPSSTHACFYFRRPLAPAGFPQQTR